MPELREVTRPYPGLRPFEAWEGEIFFGREEHTNRLLDILQRQRLLAVIGPSGSGKSSLVRAGLLPALPLGSLGTGTDWRVALMRPGNRPMQRLAQALIDRPVLGMELVGAERIPQDERQLTPDAALIEAELRRGPLGLVQVVTEARRKAGGGEPFNLLVLVDQFEELFTYADAGGREADESEALVNLLLASRSARDGRIFIVLTMRTDFLGNCVRFLDLPDAINRAQYLTPRLTREQIEKAIAGPARIFEGEVEPTLVAELINAVGNDPDQLPILQHALARMWASASRRGADPICIGWADFRAVGGVADALSRHADEVLASRSARNRIEEPLSPEQRTVEVLFRAITGQRGGEDGGSAVRRPQSLYEIGKWSGRDWREFLPAVHAYADENVNFLGYAGDLGAETVIDISHEALIRQWGRLRDWVADEARLAREYRRWRERAEARAAGAGALLAGADLARAVEWRDGAAWNTQSFCKPAPAWASRYRSASAGPPDEEFDRVLQFIGESQQVVLRAERRERRLKWALIGLTVMSLSAMAVAIGFWQQASRQLIAHEAAALWHPLDFQDLYRGAVNESQAEGLLRLARSDESRKRVFLEQLLRREALASRFNHRPDLILGAAIGLNLDRRRWFLERLHEVQPKDAAGRAFRVTRALASGELEGDLALQDLIGAIQAAAHSYQQLEVLGSYAAVLSGGLSEAEARAATEEFLTAIGTTEDQYPLTALRQALITAAGQVSEAEAGALTEKFLAAIGVNENADQFLALAHGLAALPGKLSASQADALFDRLLTTARSTDDYSGQQTREEVWSKLAGRVPDEYAEAWIEKLLVALGTTKSFSERQTVGQGLTAMAGRVPEARAEAVSLRLLGKIEDPKSFDRLFLLGQALAAATGRVPAARVGTVAEPLVAAFGNSDNPYRIAALLQGVAALPGKLTEEQAEALSDRLLLAIRATHNIEQLGALGQAAAELAGKMPETRAGALNDRFVAALQQAEHPSQLLALAYGVADSPASWTEAQAEGVTRKFLAAVETTTSPYRLEALAGGAAALAERLTAAQAGALVEKFLVAIGGTYVSNPYLARDSGDLLGRNLAALAPKVSEAQAAILANQFLAAFLAAKDSFHAAAIGPGLAALAGRVPEADAKAATDQYLAAMAAIGDQEDRFKTEVLGQALAAAAGRVSAGQAEAVTDQVLAAIQTARDFMYLQALGNGLAAAAGRVPEYQADAVSGKFLAALQSAREYARFDALGRGLAAAAERMDTDPKAASLLFEALKNPLIPRDATSEAIRRRFPDAPAEAQGFWALIEWAGPRFRHLDLAAPLREPAEIAGSLRASSP